MKITFPPDNASEAGTWRNSRVYEAFPIVFPIFTYLIVLWCCVVHFLIFSVIKDGDVQYLNMLERLGAPNPLVDPYLEPKWKFLTSTYVHTQATLIHLIFNLMWLMQLGPLMERGIGTAKTVLFFVATGFVSSAIATSIEGAGIGMSGVVYALVGFMWTAWPRWTGFLEKFNGQVVKLLLFWQVICFVLTYSGTMNIGNVAHISGMIYGALIGKWACAGNKHGKQWMAATIAFTLFGIFCAYKPMSAWF